MSRNKFLKFFLGVFILSLFLGAEVGLAKEKPGGIILQQAIGARALGMGEAFVGLADDASSLYWNVAGILSTSGGKLKATYVRGIDEIEYGQIMLVQNLSSKQAIGLGVIYLRGGMISLYENFSEGIMSQQDVVSILGYTIALQKNIKVGLALKVLNTSLAEKYTTTVVGADLGMLLTLNKKIKVGLSIKDIGQEIKYLEQGDSMPLRMILGTSYKFVEQADHRGTVTADIVSMNSQRFKTGIGLEYWYIKILGLRVGYKAGSDQNAISMGASLKWQNIQIDYAFQLVKVLDNMHYVSCNLNW